MHFDPRFSWFNQFNPRFLGVQIRLTHHFSWDSASSHRQVQLVIRHGANPNLVDERGEVLQMLSTDHLAVGESVIEIVSCNERLLEHAKAAWAG